MNRKWRREGLKLALNGVGGLLLFGVGGGAMFAELHDAPALGSRVAAWTVLVLGVPLVLASLWAVFSGLVLRKAVKLNAKAIELRFGLAKSIRFPYSQIEDAQILFFAQGELIGLKANADATRDALMDENLSTYGFDWILDVRSAGASPETFLAELQPRLSPR